MYALAQSAGQITNFGVLTWTQRIKFKLINPLLGSNCYIGSDNNPIVINPELSVGPGGQLQVLPDPNPTKHPDTEVLAITLPRPSTTPSPRPVSPAAARVARRTSRSTRRSTSAPACLRRPGSTAHAHGLLRHRCLLLRARISGANNAEDPAVRVQGQQQDRRPRAAVRGSRTSCTDVLRSMRIHSR